MFDTIKTTKNYKININPFDKIIKLNEGDEAIAFENKTLIKKVIGTTDIITNTDLDTDTENNIENIENDENSDIYENMTFSSLFKNKSKKLN